MLSSVVKNVDFGTVCTIETRVEIERQHFRDVVFHREICKKMHAFMTERGGQKTATCSLKTKGGVLKIKKAALC